jgi:hypothetical protein
VPPESALREGSLLFTQCRRASRFTHPQLGLASVRRRAPFLAAVTIAMHGPYRDWPCIWSGVELALALRQETYRPDPIRVETVWMHNPVSTGKPFGPDLSRVAACNISVLKLLGRGAVAH